MDRSKWLAERKQRTVERYDLIFAPVYDEKWGRLSGTHAMYVEEVARRVGPQGTVLDAACGTGKYWDILRRSGARVVGVDQSREMLRRLTEKYPGATVYVQRLQDLDLATRFDAVICVDAMEFVPPEDWPVVIGRFKRHVSPGGLLYVTVEIEDDEVLDEAYCQAMRLGMPVTYGEVALEGYHFYPSRPQVLEWLSEASIEVLKDSVGDGYWHLLCSAVR